MNIWKRFNASTRRRNGQAAAQKTRTSHNGGVAFHPYAVKLKNVKVNFLIQRPKVSILNYPMKPLIYLTSRRHLQKSVSEVFLRKNQRI